MGTGGNFIPVREAPIDGEQYAREDGGWSEITSGGGGGITDILYDDLVTAIGSSLLSPGSLYRITDFATTYWMLDDNASECNYGNPVVATPEPLIVLATSETTLAKEAYSESFPNDIIWYDWDASNYQNDYGFFYTGDLPDWKGVITFRHETIYNNSAGYDIRSVVFRRWAATADDWVTETSYSAGDYVMYDSDIYMCLFDNADVAWTATNWVKVLELGTNVYWNCSPTQFNGIDSDPDDYQDFYTFYSLSDNSFANNKIAITNEDYQNQFYTRLSNIVFTGSCLYNTFETFCGIMTFGQGCYSNTFGQGCNSNTFGQGCYYNIFEQGCYSNTFGQNCSSNTFEQDCYYNTFGQNCSSNTFGQDCNSNTFGQDCGSNTFGQYCNSNTFEQDCGSNTFGKNCSSNTFEQDCYYNIFEQDCNSNTFGQGCYYNIFEQGCNSNTFGQGCSYNIFEQNCYSNTFGHGCYSNTFGQGCGSNTFVQNCYYNIFEQDCDSNTLPDSSLNNLLEASVSNTDFSSSCDITQPYNCRIIVNSASVVRVTYFNASDELVVTDVDNCTTTTTTTAAP